MMRRLLLLGALVAALGVGVVASAPAQFGGMLVPFDAGGGTCPPFSQSTAGTATYTPTSSCTMRWQAWGAGGGGGGRVSSVARGGGGAGYAENATMSMIAGRNYTVVIGTPGDGGGSFGSGEGAAGTLSYICDSTAAGCTAGLTTCSGTGLTTSNFVCAHFGRGSGTIPNGGLAASSIGATLTKNGGNGAAGNGGGCPNGCGGGAGGAGGPDGDGVAGNAYTGGGTQCTGASASGGAGDAGTGGAGGAQASGSADSGDGGTDANHGGGGGGGAEVNAGIGGTPGGGGGGSWCYVGVGPPHQEGAPGRVAGS